jgi:hypothetical protein
MSLRSCGLPGCDADLDHGQEAAEVDDPDPVFDKLMSG